MFSIKQKVAQTAKRAGLLSGGLLLCSVGVAFLTVAGWIALSPLIGVLNTALVFAGLYLGIGLIMIGSGVQNSQRASQQPSAPPQGKAATTQPLMEAFMCGIQAGARADQARR